MIRRKFAAILTAVCLWACVLPVTVTTTGCVPQNTLAALTSTFGNAAAGVAAAEGNSALAQKITSDTALAVTAIQNWKAGTVAQNVVQAIQLVEEDISAFPIGGQYEPLVILALSTAASIIELLNPNVSTRVMIRKDHSRHLQLADAPKTAKDFKARWNKIRNSNSSLSGAPVL